MPASVTVLFHRRNQVYGTEETVRRDTLQWSTTPLYSVTVAAPATFSGAVGTHTLWDDFTVRFDTDGNAVAADVTTAAAIAAARSQQYFNDIYNGTTGYMRQVYTGTVPFVTGSQVDGVIWRQDRRVRQGWITEIWRGGDGP